MENEILRILEKLPKYIETNKSLTYSLIIYKNNWDGHEDSWIIMYSKKNEKSLSTVNVLIQRQGNTFLKALREIEIAIDEFRDENERNPNIERM